VPGTFLSTATVVLYLFLMAQGAGAQLLRKAPPFSDSVIARSDFRNDEASGWLKFLPSYSPDYLRIVYVWMSTKDKVRFYCLTYADFQFDLEDASAMQSGHKIANAKLGLPVSTPAFGGAVPSATSGKAAPCLYPASNQALLVFSRDDLYPRLRPGSYTLEIKVAPRDHSLEPFALPKVPLRIST